MKFVLALIFCLSLSFGFSQNQHSGIVLDTETKEPIEFVGVFNHKDHTISNEDGRFTFSSSKDSIIFYRVGYDKLQTKFGNLKDTIFLEKSVFELNEVVVTNSKSLLEMVMDSLQNNHPSIPFVEKFNLRASLKINDTLVRIQDLQGKLKRRTLFYPNELKPKAKDYEIELTNMRQIGLVTDPNGIYIVFPSFSRFLNLLVTIDIQKEYELEESTLSDGKLSNVAFLYNPEEKIKNVSGRILINTKKNTIEEYYYKSEPKNPPYQKNRSFRYRTTFYDVSVIFEEHPVTQKYYISSAKFNATIEGTNLDKTFNSKYDLSFILSSFDHFGDFQVNKNVKTTKDIFKLKYPYNPNYWNSQNQLLLTKEMQDFISRMGEENKEFKVRSNMN